MRNLAQIGFEVQSLEEFQALAEMVVRDGKAHRAGRNQYYCFSDPSGAQLWAQVDENDEISGMTAHFSGPCQLEARLLRAQAYEDRPLDGTFEARPLHTDAAMAATHLAPVFAFDLPDAHLVPAVALPAAAHVQLTAFAREVRCYPTVEDYRAAQPGQPLGGFAMLQADHSPDDQRISSLATLDGIIAEAKTLRNAHTQRNFYWLAVQTAVGKVDVVASTRSLPTQPLVGQIFHGQARCTGRVQLLEHVEQRPGLVERFFWGAHSNRRLA